MGLGGGTFSGVRWLSNTGNHIPLHAHQGAPQQALGGGDRFARFFLTVHEDGMMMFRHLDADKRDTTWGLYLPSDYLEVLLSAPIRFYVGTPSELKASWVVCK